MKKADLYTNYVDGNETFKAKILDALKNGYAVRIGADCIGHTRAEMVVQQGMKYLESLGAKPIEKDFWGVYYAL